MWRGLLSPRRVAVLAGHLPPEAAVWRGSGADDQLLSREAQQLIGLRNDLRSLLQGEKADLIKYPSDRQSDGLRARSSESKLDRFRARQQRKAQVSITQRSEVTT